MAGNKPEILIIEDDKNGYILTTPTPQEFADKIMLLLNDKTNAIISIVAGKESVYNTLNNYMLEDTSEDQV
jgi:hypothetical protein